MDPYFLVNISNLKTNKPLIAAITLINSSSCIKKEIKIEDPDNAVLYYKLNPPNLLIAWNTIPPNEEMSAKVVDSSGVICSN